MKENFTFGANILDNLTTGMYIDPLVLYREYIQNACDSIDKAVEYNVLKSDKQGRIEVWLDKSKRQIEIEDNGYGIPAKDFKRVLGNIADSDKILGEDKGFRGIGRLCGLAYCGRLKFISKKKGETIISTLICDAKEMRKLLADHQSKQQKYLASEILTQIYEFKSEETTAVDKHYFKVVLEDVGTQNDNLLDISLIKEYLSFVAPVAYQNTFYYRSKIYEMAKKDDMKIDEYSVQINGEDVFKKYVTVLKDRNNKKYDEIADVSFKKFNDSNGTLIAWMWVGVHQFKQAIPKNNLMRGIRLRKHNIQIGDEDALQKLFKEDRGNSYFIGEVFALDKNLVPNARRDYFNENQAKKELEKALKMEFDQIMYKTYHLGSYINSRVKKIKKYENTKTDFEEEKKVGFAGKEHEEQMEAELTKTEQDAKRAQKEINKKLEKIPEDSLLSKVAIVIEQNLGEGLPQQPDIIEHTNANNSYKTKKSWRTDKLSSLSKQERKLVGKIFDIIFTVVEKGIAEKVVSKIEEELR